MPLMLVDEQATGLGVFGVSTSSFTQEIGQNIAVWYALELNSSRVPHVINPRTYATFPATEFEGGVAAVVLNPRTYAVAKVLELQLALSPVTINPRTYRVSRGQEVNTALPNEILIFVYSRAHRQYYRKNLSELLS